VIAAGPAVPRRVIDRVQDDVLVLAVVTVGHRGEVYDR
jgi:hypothetical protein